MQYQIFLSTTSFWPVNRYNHSRSQRAWEYRHEEVLQIFTLPQTSKLEFHCHIEFSFIPKTSLFGEGSYSISGDTVLSIAHRFYLTFFRHIVSIVLQHPLQFQDLACAISSLKKFTMYNLKQSWYELNSNTHKCFHVFFFPIFKRFVFIVTELESVIWGY